MKPIIFNLFGETSLSQSLQTKLGLESGDLVMRTFPDKESYLKINTNIKERDIIILDSLHDPNKKILPLLFFVKLAKELGAKNVGLIAPYLAYMRQDKRFNPGEAITSNYFAELLSHYIDWLVTIDPHLHRHHSLDEIYSIPTTVVSASKPISDWIKAEVTKPLLIGPDEESEQWIAEIAKYEEIPYLILEKTRKGDREVAISSPKAQPYDSHTPVLVDDIISTAHTMIETTRLLRVAKMRAPICIGVHGIFTDTAHVKLQQAGAAMVVTCNSIPHPTNEIDLSPVIATIIVDYFTNKSTA